MTAPTTAGGAVLPVLMSAFRTTETRGDRDPAKRRYHMVFTFPTIEAMHAADDEWMALTAPAPAQAEIDALRAELAQANDERDERQAWCADESTRNSHLTRERDALRAENEQWKSSLWAVARELNCLPSTFSDGNSHVLKAAISLRTELAALKAALNPPAHTPPAGVFVQAAQDDQARDAGRYRWLRANREEQTAEGTAVDAYDEDGTLLWYDYLDAAIDSAIAATKETP